PTARFCGNCRHTLAPSLRQPPDERRADPLPAYATQLRSIPETERKQVTTLFADVVNSTALIERLDPEQASARMRPALDSMMTGVRRFGGVVSKSLGDGIMALFGAPTGQEDHAIRACLAALAIREAFTALASRGLQVRIGLNSGEV